MRITKLFIIWAGNLEFELIRKARDYFKSIDPKCQIRVRNADVYAGTTDVENCDGAFVQLRYWAIAQDFRAAGIEPISYLVQESAQEPSNDRSVDRCSQVDEAGSNDNPDPQVAGIESPDQAGILPAGPVPQGDRLANASRVYSPRGRKGPGRKA